MVVNYTYPASYTVRCNVLQPLTGLPETSTLLFYCLAPCALGMDSLLGHLERVGCTVWGNQQCNCRSSLMCDLSIADPDLELLSNSLGLSLILMLR